MVASCGVCFVILYSEFLLDFNKMLFRFICLSGFAQQVMKSCEHLINEMCEEAVLVMCRVEPCWTMW